jgi:hypothetical protein
MPTYRMEIITQTLTITADTEEQAEEKYDIYFNGGDCPCGVGGGVGGSGSCDCVDDDDECFHNTEKIGD